MRYFSLFIFCLCLSSMSRAQVVVRAAIDHIVPDGIDNAGNITLSVSGSTAPYTYTWNPGGITTQNRTNIAAGSYSLQVKSASTQTYANTYSLGYKVLWTNTDRCVSRNDSLISQSSSVFPNVLYGTAVSQNVLPANTDGWFEYVVDNNVNQFIGFLDSIAPVASTYTDIDYGVLVTGTSLQSYQNGTVVVLNSAAKAGDVIRVERNSNTIVYKLNSVAVRTLTVSGVSQKVFKLKAATTYNGRFLNVGCSFNQLDQVPFINYVSVIPKIMQVSPGASNGSISLSPRLGGSLSYSWQPSGATSSSISGLSAGTYSTTVQNSLSSKSSYVYTVSNKVQWVNTTLCTFRNDSLIPGFTNYAYRASAFSKNTLPAGTDGYMEYVIDVSSSEDYHIGFLDEPSSNLSLMTDIDYGFFYYGTYKIIYSYENGSLVQLTNALRVGDVVRIERIGNTVNYKVNGLTLRTVTVAGLSSLNWKLKANLQPQSRLANIGTSFINTTNISFPNFVRANAKVTHSSGPGISDGAVNLVPLVTAAYSYSWQPGSSTTATQTALSSGSVSATITDSDGNRSTIVSNVGYKVRWTNMDRCFLRNDSLISPAVVADVYATAASRNTLTSGTDGWFEYRIGSLGPNSHYVGFLDALDRNANIVTDLDYAVRYNASNTTLYAFENNTFYNLSQAVQLGDLVRVERIGNTINYKVNGSTMRTVTVAGIGLKNWKLKAALQAVNNLANVGCSFVDAGNVSFPNYVRVTPLIGHSSGNDGKIALTPMVPYVNTYSWQLGPTTNSLSGLYAGTYSVEVGDSLSNRSSYTYTVGARLAWTSFTNTALSNDTLSGTVTGAGAASSSNQLVSGTNGWFSHVLTSVSKTYCVGFADSLYGVATGITDIDYGFYIDGGNQFAFTAEGGTINVLSYAPRLGDVVSLERSGDTIKYRWNGTVLRSVVAAGYGLRKLRIKAMLNNKAQLINAGCSFGVQLPFAVSASVSNYQGESAKGQIQYVINGGTTPYNIAWQGRKLSSSTVVYHALIDSMPGAVADSVAFKAQIDALKQQSLFTGLNPGTYTTTVYSNGPDSVTVISTVGGPDSLDFARGITTSLTAIGTRTVNNIIYNTSKGLVLTQQGTYSAGNHYAVLKAGFDSQTGGAINVMVPSASTKASLGLQEKKDGVDGYPDEMMIRTMFRFNGNGTFDIIYQNATVLSGSVSANDLFSIRKEASGTKLGYYKNETLLIEKDFGTIAPAAGLVGKAVLGGVGVALGPINVSAFMAPTLSITTEDMLCGGSCIGKIIASGISGFVPSVPYSYALYDASDVLLSTVTVTSSVTTATFTGLCAGKYTVKYTYRETPLYDLNSGSAPASTLKTMNQAVDIGYMPSWTNVINASDISPNHSLQKTAGSTLAWDAGASTFNTLKAGAPGTHWMEWTANAIADDQNSFGLTGADVNTNPFALDFYGIYLYRSGKTNLYSLISGGAALLNGAGTYAENDKFRIEKTVSGGTYSLVFRRNNVIIGQVNAIANKDFIADAAIYRLNDKIYLPRLSFGCPDAPVYAILKKTVDGGYYQALNQELYFKYTEEYADVDGKLLINVYNDQNQKVINGASLGTLTPAVAYGDNYYQVYLGNTGYTSGQLLPAGFYTLEVINEKNEKWYLRFKK